MLSPVTRTANVGSGVGGAPILPTKGRDGMEGHHSPQTAPVLRSKAVACAGQTIQSGSVVNLALNSAVLPCSDRPRCGHLLLTAKMSSGQRVASANGGELFLAQTARNQHGSELFASPNGSEHCARNPCGMPGRGRQRRGVHCLSAHSPPKDCKRIGFPATSTTKRPPFACSSVFVVTAVKLRQRLR